jgi:ribosome hibernation promoting factor
MLEEMMQAELRIRNMDLADVLQGYIDRRLRFALSRFGDRVGRVVVTLPDVNGTGRGVVKSCQISAELRPFGQVTARETDPDLYTAIDRAAGRVGRLSAVRLGREKGEVMTPALIVVRARGTRREKKLSSKRQRRLPRKRLPKTGPGTDRSDPQERVGVQKFARDKAAHPRRK